MSEGTAETVQKSGEVSSLFRKTALEKVSSPEQLDSYIKVNNPSIWIVLIAAIILLFALFYWGVNGLIPTTVSTNGVIRDGQAVCYLSPDKVTEVNAGDPATVMGVSGSVVSVSTTPVSSNEASRNIDSDYTISKLNLSDWNYIVTIQADGLPTNDTLVPIAITATEIAPISFLLN